MHLPADSPGEWLELHVSANLTPGQRASAIPMSRLVEGGWLGEEFARIAPDDPWRQYRITSLSTWYPGTIAAELGFAFAGADAGFVPAARDVRWVLQEGASPGGVVFAANTRAVVTADHPWADHPHATVVSSRDEVRRLAVEAIVNLAAPLVDHLVAVTRAGRYGLWHQVVDALPNVLTMDGQVPVTAELVEDFEAMLSRTGNPWRGRPTLEVIDAAWGPVGIAYRAGCCLAHLGYAPSETEDETLRRYYAELPEPESTRRFCLNCKFRTVDDSRTRQLWWRRHEILREVERSGADTRI